nr:uncharacterized protein LOC111504796 [Leptinotarsa decemlineata]
MWSRKYYQYVEKETHRVSSLWKVLHVSIFLLTAINSLISSYGYGNISKIFGRRCVLYATPNLKLREVTNRETSTRNVTIDDITIEAILDMNQTDSTLSSEEQKMLVLDLSKLEKLSYKNKTFISERRFWFDNGTLSGKISMEFMGTVFGKTITCDFILFIPLSSLVIAAALGVIAILCGKGGRGYESDVLPGSWSFVYPVIFTSALMTLLL